jgi:hypothetical protein
MVSLTKNEFKKRLGARHELLGLGMTNDMHDLFPRFYVTETEMPVEFSDALTKFAARMVSRVIELVYNESLD